jgi:hypothetical protein
MKVFTLCQMHIDLQVCKSIFQISLIRIQYLT